MPTIEFTDHSDTITSSGASQQVMAANGDREMLILHNPSDTDMWWNYDDDADDTDPGSFLLEANGGFYESPAGGCSSQAVNIFCSAAGKKFTAKEGS